MLNASKSVIVAKLQAMEDIIFKWKTNFTNGIPFIDIPGSAEDLETFVEHFTGELRLVAGDADNLADVIRGTR